MPPPPPPPPHFYGTLFAKNRDTLIEQSGSGYSNRAPELNIIWSYCIVKNMHSNKQIKRFTGLVCFLNVKNQAMKHVFFFQN